MRRVVFLALTLIMALILSGCGSPGQSVKMFLKYRIKGDIDAAKLYCTDAVDSKIDMGEYTVEQLGFGDPYGKPISWEGVKGTINLVTESETSEGAVLSSGSGPKEVTYHLRREGGMWKINDIEPALIALAPSDKLDDLMEEASEAKEESEGEGS